MALLVPPPLKRAARGSKRKIQGLAFLLLVVVLFWLVTAFYNKKFTPIIPVSLRTDRIGNQLPLNADVKFRGVLVGDVRALTTNGETATLRLAINPNRIDAIPSNVSARILPKTLFGQKYVELVSPTVDPSARPLRKGDVIPQDRTTVGIEIEQLYDNLLPFLQIVQPEKLNQTLTAIATALEGRGDELGDNMVRLDDYLRQINPHLPSIQQDVTELANVSDIYAQAAPDLLRFLDNTVVTSRTIVQKQSTLLAFFTGTANTSNLTSNVLSENRNRLIQLPAVGEPITRELALRSDNLPPTINGLAALAPRLETVFGGSAENRNWLHINLSILGAKGGYTKADCPVYSGPAGTQYGPNCSAAARSQSAATPSSVGEGTATEVPSEAPVSVPKPSAEALAPVDTSGTDNTTDTVGSPQEKAMLASLVGTVNSQQATTHDMSPDLADLFLGPMFRGTAVSFK